MDNDLGDRRSGGRRTPPVSAMNNRTDASRWRKPRAIDPNDSPLLHRLHTSSCSVADNPQILITTVERLSATSGVALIP
jgi:hypothetical protein